MLPVALATVTTAIVVMTADGPLNDLGTRTRPEDGTPPCAEQTRDDKNGAGPPPVRVAGRRGRVASGGNAVA